MAFEAYDDLEQGERVRQWLRGNAVAIVAGLVIAMVVIFGMGQWRRHQQASASEASRIYEQLFEAQQAGQAGAAQVYGAALSQHFASSGYAAFGALQLAQLQLNSKQLEPALTQLRWAAQHSQDEALKPLIGIRIAQVLLAQGKTEDALAELKTVDAPAYAGRREELRGDALVKLGRADEARQAYQASLQALDPDVPQRNVIQMKLDDLASAGKQGA
ncbi:YfgM family protein [Frateuria aurantia]